MIEGIGHRLLSDKGTRGGTFLAKTGSGRWLAVRWVRAAGLGARRFQLRAEWSPDDATIPQYGLHHASCWATAAAQVEHLTIDRASGDR